jgi:hypothetical protein
MEQWPQITLWFVGMDCLNYTRLQRPVGCRMYIMHDASKKQLKKIPAGKPCLLFGPFRLSRLPLEKYVDANRRTSRRLSPETPVFSSAV